MCTSIAWRRGDSYFGRTLDVDTSYGEKVLVTPRRYLFHLKNGSEYRTTYALMGMGVAAGTVPLYYEAFNEKGLAMAGLNFPESAAYATEVEGKDNIVLSELIPWILGQSTTVAEARMLLSRLNLWGKPAGQDAFVPTLHYMIADRLESIVVESDREGLHIYDNPYNVMTNEPPFPVQEWNLRRYRNLSSSNLRSSFTKDYDLPDFAVGMGAMGLPGDCSSTSRFVRAAFNLANSHCEDTEKDNVSQFFHVLDSVSMVKGATLTRSGKEDLTVYTCCMNLDQRIYYYTTYGNRQLTALSMDRADLDGESLTVYPLVTDQQIRFDN